MKRACETRPILDEMLPGITTSTATGPGTPLAVRVDGFVTNQVLRIVHIDGKKPDTANHPDTNGSGAAPVLPATQYDPSLIEAFFGMSEPDPATPDEVSGFPLPFGVTACGELAARGSARS